MVSEPKLDKPGAGLPFYEWFIANYFLVPFVLRQTDHKKSLRFFAATAEKILTICRALTNEQMAQRVLIPRLTGLEDSSRYWSVAMTLEHLVIVTSRMQQVIQDLSAGGTELAPVGVADLKPNPLVDPAATLANFEQLQKDFLVSTANLDTGAFAVARYTHPWFGPLNATEWSVFAGLHLNIHLKQIKAISKRLSDR